MRALRLPGIVLRVVVGEGWSGEGGGGGEASLKMGGRKGEEPCGVRVRWKGAGRETQCFTKVVTLCDAVCKWYTRGRFTSRVGVEGRC